METKPAIRKTMLALRESIPLRKKEEYDEKIRDLLLSRTEFQTAEVILLYISIGSEVDTRRILTACLELGKQVFCPKITGKGKMDFFAVTGLDDLEEGRFHLPEPVGTQMLEKKTETRKILMVMPLVAFDRAGNRLGYGGGYYDRYLEDWLPRKTIALAYEEQCFPGRIPIQTTDIRPDRILTPKGMRNI